MSQAPSLAMPGNGAPDRVADGVFAAICFALVLPFTGLVLWSGRVGIAELGRLIGLFVGIAAMLALTAIILFSAVEFLRNGQRSRWSDHPTRALLASFARRWSEDRLFSLAWPVALFLLLLPSFNAFKQRLLPEAGFRFDRALAEADRWLFGGDPGLLLHQWIGSPAVTLLFDAVYHSWFVPTTLGLCIVGLCTGVRTRAQYMLSYVAVWLVLGAGAAWLFPAAGPAFYAALVDPAAAGPFAAIHAQLAEAGRVEFLTSLANQEYLLRNMGAPTLVIGGGISAIPSVHNAMAVLFALASFRINLWLGVAMTLFALLIWVASVYLNWHYAVDGIAGAVGAAVIWFAAGRVVDLVLARLAAQAPQADGPAVAA